MKYLKPKHTICSAFPPVKKTTLFALSILAFICITVAISEPTAAIAMATVPFVSLAKFAKKETDLSDEEKELLGTIEERMNTAMEEFSKGTISKEEFTQAIDEIKKLIEESGKTSAASEEVQKELKELKTMLKTTSKEIQDLKDKGFRLGNGSPLDKAIDNLLDSQKFKDFANGVDKKSGKIELCLKDVVSMGGNYAGSTLISQQNGRIVEHVAERRLNLRDVMLTEQGDAAYPSITYTEIETLDRGAASVSENGRLPKSSFSIKEKTESTKRIGTYLQISKRLLKSRVYVKSWLLNRLPKWIRLAEDFQIMFGDGHGNNLEGIAKRALCASKWITDTVVSGKAGDIIALASYNDGKQTRITFATPFDKIGEGMKITIAGASKIGETENPLNASHLLHKETDRAVIIDLAYTAIGAITDEQAKALTFTVKNNFFNEVETADLGDAVKAIFSVLTYAEYSPNAIVLHPSTIFEIETVKDTTGRSLALVTIGANGIKTIAGRPVVESTAIAPGYYFAGDMNAAASLVDYTTLEIEFAEDVECKISGYVVAIAQEEVIMPVYNKYAFAYGKLSDVKTAITKP